MFPVALTREPRAVVSFALRPREVLRGLDCELAEGHHRDRRGERERQVDAAARDGAVYRAAVGRASCSTARRSASCHARGRAPARLPPAGADRAGGPDRRRPRRPRPLSAPAARPPAVRARPRADRVGAVGDRHDSAARAPARPALGRAAPARLDRDGARAGRAVLLLDEPTTYLDLAHQLEVLDLLRRLNSATAHDRARPARPQPGLPLRPRARRDARRRRLRRGPAGADRRRHARRRRPGPQGRGPRRPVSGAPLCIRSSRAARAASRRRQPAPPHHPAEVRRADHRDDEARRDLGRREEDPPERVGDDRSVAPTIIATGSRRGGCRRRRGARRAGRAARRTRSRRSPRRPRRRAPRRPSAAPRGRPTRSPSVVAELVVEHQHVEPARRAQPAAAARAPGHQQLQLAPALRVGRAGRQVTATEAAGSTLSTGSVVTARQAARRRGREREALRRPAARRRRGRARASSPRPAREGGGQRLARAAPPAVARARRAAPTPPVTADELRPGERVRTPAWRTDADAAGGAGEQRDARRGARC